MILVCLGTQDKEFRRLLIEVERLVESRKINDKVVVQAGCTKFSSSKMEVYDFFSVDEFNDLVKRCDLLITHGGVGTILDALKYNKKIIAFPRLYEYGEHVNDHQVQIVNEFFNAGYLLTGEVSNLDILLDQVSDFIPKKHKSNNYKFNKMLQNCIEKW